jgi:hypothetical protein
VKGPFTGPVLRPVTRMRDRRTDGEKRGTEERILETETGEERDDWREGGERGTTIARLKYIIDRQDQNGRSR